MRMTRREFLLALPATAGVAGCLGLDARTAATPLAAAALSESNAALAFDLFGRLRTQPGNIVYSPLSVAASLALASAAANGTTLDEFQRVLHWSGEPAALHPAVATLQRQIAAGMVQSGCELRAAYALWTPKTLPVSREFRSIVRSNYDGAWQTTEFAQPDAAARDINNWAELQTAFKIKELAKPDDLGTPVRLVLASAIYFKGLWAKTFPRASSAYDAFHFADGTKSPAMFMRHSARHRLAEGDGWQMLELVFAGGALAMFVLMPRAAAGLPAVEASLTVETFQRLMHDLQPQSVIVSLPRFRIATTWNLRDALTDLGLRRAFQLGEADFSRLSARDSLALSAVIQKSAIDVVEEGAEVSKETGTVGKPQSAAKAASDPKVFAANRPFLFAVRDAASGSMLLLGRVEKP
jgi:serine protease inhibitor